jgi:uncharacterized protein YndB with AHSA1/START domain
MTDTQTTAVTTSIVVDTAVDKAFAVFTEDMASWWPQDHHIIEAPLSHMVFEARVGGDIYDVGTDGSECRWARVLAYEPPSRIVFTWNITTQWKAETDMSRVSEVEVRFIPEGTARTRVELEHRHLDRHGEGWEGMRDAVGSAEGWNAELRHFASRLEQEKVVPGNA